MAPPERQSKRQKLSPAEDQLSTNSASSTSPNQPGRIPDQLTAQASSAPNAQSSWYNRTWPRKTVPIAEVARESISSASSSAIETASLLKDKVRNTPTRRTSLALTLGKTTSNKSLPANAATTKDHATSQSRKPSKEQTGESVQPKDTKSKVENEAIPPVQESDQQKTQMQEEAQLTTTAVAQPEAVATEETRLPQATTAPRSWIGWLARGDGAESSTSASTNQTQEATEATKATMLPEENHEDISETIQQTTDAGPSSAKPTEETTAPSTALQRRSWIPYWNNVTATQSDPAISLPAKPISTDVPEGAGVTEPTAPARAQEEAEAVPDTPSITSDTLPKQSQATDKGSTWGFWSRGKPMDTRSLNEVSKEDPPAITKNGTENEPRRASADLKKPVPDDTSPSKSTVEPLASAEVKSQRESKDVKKGKATEAKGNAKAIKIEGNDATATAVSVEPQPVRPATPTAPKKSYEHLLLPPFKETLMLPENLTWMQQLARLIYGTKEPAFKHINLAKDRPRIKKALAIGVHGYFPAPLIRSVLGQPTGTSVKFAEMASKSILQWTKREGYECQVKSAALEGEGKIAERVDLLWKLLLNWIEEIRKSDLVLIACHSQGVPVATMLVAKLIHFGCIASTTRVGICAMAGVNMGPFTEFKSRWISGSAGELFEFSDPSSRVSTDYLAALDDVLKFGVRITYAGSIDDQLVSLESSLFAPISHPHIYRAVSIDSRIHAPSFLSHLVGFALKLRNLGVQDHGLIRELSAPLAGSLYSGEGHSRLYEDSAIYDLAISFTLETTSMPSVPLTQRHISSSTGNPFILPFAMRGMLEEDFVKSDLQEEAGQLLKEFDEWKPTTKALKDVKWRLEGIRSRL